jgi:glucokinase
VILAGDIGGTKTVIALFEERAGVLHEAHAETFPSQSHSSLEEILAKFLKTRPGMKLTAGCFGVAGPIIAGKSKITNLPWEMAEDTLAAAVGVKCVKLLNDLEAAAYGMLHLKADEFCVLNEGSKPARQGNMAVIAAGTGLGEALLVWDGQRFIAVASEGGHADFAPRDALEVRLFTYLSDKYHEHVSYERVLSGPGLLDLYTFMRRESGVSEPSWLSAQLEAGDPSAAVTEAALAGKDPVCVETLEHFASLYGAEAGNIALKCLAVGGVLVGGGIAPKILPALQKGTFMQGFTDKGRYRPLMQSIPVKVALNPRAPLIGAAHYAQQL